MSSPSSITKREIVLRTLGTLLAAMFFAGAGMKFAAVPFEVNSFAHFGYAPWFMVVIGALELMGAVLLLVPRLSGFGAAAMAVIMVGAVASHLRASDGLGVATPALVTLILLVGLAVIRRGQFSAAMAPIRNLQAA